MSSLENNKRIAKNTLLLYIRMFFVMGVTLYTSRVILQTLGVNDYGIYNVVGGIISMFAFINGGMVSATQRYITFELGVGDKTKLKNIFQSSLQIHAFISIIVILLGETVGLWLLYDKLVIPKERLTASICVYQCSIIACVVNILSIPYNAVIIAHEKMSAFAYISVVEVILKLGIVFVVKFVDYDKLIVYSILFLVVQIFLRLIYSYYCHKHFEETNYSNNFDIALLKDMFSFAGWSFWGALASVLYTQGLNMMLNIFFGPVVNAARSVAVQVQSAIQQFVSNFQMALNPQITKTYAAGNLIEMHSLMFRSARFSFYLIFLISLPILLETNFILTLWLKDVPEHSVVFTQLVICVSLICTISNPCIVANQATGKVKVYQAVVGGILLLILPISYILLKYGFPAYSVFIVHFCIEFIALITRMLLLKKTIHLTISDYLKNIFLPIIIIVFFSVLPPIIVHFQCNEGTLKFLIVSFTSCISIIISVLSFGLTKSEKKHLFKLLSKFVLQIKN